MKDLLRRLQGAMPSFLSWMTKLHEIHAPAAEQVSRIGLPRLSGYWPSDLLAAARAVVVPEIPFPPVAEYGLPEFQSMAAMPMAGITFGHMYFLHEHPASESVHFHELVHVVQWRELGPRAFLFAYSLGIAQHGYAQSPFERTAYEAQREFDAGRPVPGLLASVQAHARQKSDEAVELFRHHGLRMDV